MNEMMQPASAMTVFDYGVLLAMFLSAVLGAIRGLVREVLSVAGWAAAVLLAYRFCGEAAQWMPVSLPGGELLRQVLGFVLVLVLVLILANLLGALIAQVLESTGLTAVDRSLGFAFGAVRGVLIVIFAVTLLSLTELPAKAFWRDALTRPHVETAVQLVRPWLPEAFSRYIKI